MEFTNIMSNWQNEGVAPSADLQANGFQPGQRPPASVFNWQWHRTSAAITELQEKLTGVASNAEVNQNAFSNVKVGDTTIEADSKTDTLTFEAGENITLTPDAENDKVTISATDTVYTHPTYSPKSEGLYKVTVDETGHVSNTTAVTKSDITALGIPSQDTKYELPVASSSTLGGVKAVTKTDNMTSSVGIDSNGQLWSEAGGGGGGTALVDDAGVLSWGDTESAVDTSIFSSYALKSTKVDTTLSASAWSSSSPYTLPFSNSNITTTNVIEMIPSPSITSDQLKALQKANIIGGTQSSGSIVLKAMGTKPTINIPVTMIIRGDL